MHLLSGVHGFANKYRNRLPTAAAACVIALEGFRTGAFKKLLDPDYRLEESASTELLAVLSITGFLFALLMTYRTVQLDREIVRRKLAEENAQELARHDTLTGLNNRRALSEQLDVALAYTGGRPRRHAIYLIDLDRFKHVNDIHGHAAGDTVLREVARRLERATGPGAIRARFGGDEFAVVSEITSDEEAPLLADRIIELLGQPIDLGGKEVDVGGTIGISIFPDDGPDAEALLRCADLALYQAKRTVRGTYRVYDPSIAAELREKAALEVDLLRAVTSGEIKPHYQPLVSLSNQKLLGFEILSRWYHPRKGVLPPSLFIPIAEEKELITDLTALVLRQACLDARNWPPHLTLALNVSPTQLGDETLPQRLLAILTETGFAPSRLEIEITENALIGDVQVARRVLASLQNLGIRLSLDDFGMGYSSLSYLQTLNFDKLKMDQSFVRSLRESPQGVEIATAIIQLGKSLGLPVIAEGIENIADYHHLLDLGCADGQGYYFGRALSCEDVSKVLLQGELDSPLLKNRFAEAS